MNTAELHAMEHLAAIFLRSHPAFGPKDIVGVLIETFEFMRDFEGEIPSAKPEDCGNYLDSSLPMCK